MTALSPHRSVLRLRFARSRILAAVASIAVTCCAAGARAALPTDDNGEPILPQPRANGAAYARGDIRFACDPVWVYRPGTGMHVEVRLRVPNSELRFLPTAKGWESEVQFTVASAGEAATRVNRSKTLTFLTSDEATARSRDHVQMLSSQFDVQPGTYDFTISVLDRKATKRGVLNALRKKHKIGRARVRVVVPAAPAAGTVVASPLQFEWADEATVEGVAPSHVSANPARLYGLYQSAMRAYVETYDRVDTTGTHYFLRHALVTTSGETLETVVDTVEARGGAFGHRIEHDLAGLPAGRYICAVTVTREDGVTAPPTTGEFDIVWQPDSWGASNDEQLDLARFLLSEDDFLEFETLSPGQREIYLNEFWRAHDPTPDTAFNELRAEFDRRVQFVETHYAILDRGVNSDRGKVYVRLGPPDDVNTHAMPINKETVQNELENTTSGADLLNSAVPRFDENDRNRPFEVWTYDRGGHPLFGDNTANQHQVQLTFVFIDQRGWGDYSLKYTSEGVKH